MSETNEQQDEEVKPEVYEVDPGTLKSGVQQGLYGHIWQQRGPYLVCTSCEIEHGLHVGTRVHYQGMDTNGQMILKKV